MTLATEVKVELVRNDLDIGTLAERSGISRTSLSKKLNGHVGFKYEELRRIGDALNVPAWELVRRAEEAQTRKENTND